MKNFQKTVAKMANKKLNDMAKLKLADFDIYINLYNNSLGHMTKSSTVLG